MTRLSQNPNHGVQTVKQRTAMVGKGSTKCGNCVHFPICSKQAIKNVKEDTDYCQWQKPGHYLDKNLVLINNFPLTLSKNEIKGDSDGRIVDT